MIYADYAFYMSVYMGSAINDTDFPRLARRASAFLDYYTQGRAKENPNIRELKMACCAIAEQEQIIEQAQMLAAKSLASGIDSDEVQSESVGSWSRSYRSGGESASAAETAAANAQSSLASLARQYLSGTNLLYRGGRCRHGYVSTHGDGL